MTEAPPGADEVDEAVVALRQAATDVGLVLLVLRVHAVRAEALAQLHHRRRAGSVEQLIDDHDIAHHAREASQQFRVPMGR